MKLKLVSGDSAEVVTAYYMCSENAAGPERDELDIEFLGNRTGEPYLIQTNVYKNGTGEREMRHTLWFDLLRISIPSPFFGRTTRFYDWATRGGLEKTDWSKEPFVSSNKDFSVDACQWEDTYPTCVSSCRSEEEEEKKGLGSKKLQK